MHLKFNKSYGVVLFAAIIGIWVYISIGHYINNLTKIEIEAASENLKSSTEHNATEVHSIFQRYISLLNAVAVTVQDSAEYHSSGTMSKLQKIATASGFSRISIDTVDGKSYTSDGQKFDITQPEHLEKIKNGETFIYVDTSILDKAQNFNIIVPIYNSDGTYISSLQGTLSMDTLYADFNETFSRSGGYYLLIDSKGNYITITNKAILRLKTSNFFTETDSYTFNDETTENQLMKSFADQESGFIKYTYSVHMRYAYYTPVHINDWIMVTTAPKESIEQKTSLHLKNALYMTAQITVVLAIISVYIYISQKNSKNKILLNQKYLEALTEYSGKTMYEFEIKTKKLRKLTNLDRIFYENFIMSTGIDNELSSNQVLSEDKEKLDYMFSMAKDGHNFNDCKLRIRNSDGEYRWYSITGVSVTDAEGKPYKTIAFLEDINDQVLRETYLSNMAERDSLTGLYNKATTELLINEILNTPESSNNSHALLIIDIDNFKDVNDKLGHKFGDDVLMEISQSIKSLYRSNDIIGRIGGDEFFVFMKNCNNEKLIKSKATDVCKLINKIYSEGDISVSISASVGIALYPKNGKDFDSLYKNADNALYIVKEHGKNNYVISDGISIANYQSKRSQIDS